MQHIQLTVGLRPQEIRAIRIIRAVIRAIIRAIPPFLPFLHLHSPPPPHLAPSQTRGPASFIAENGLCRYEMWQRDVFMGYTMFCCCALLIFVFSSSHSPFLFRPQASVLCTGNVVYVIVFCVHIFVCLLASFIGSPWPLSLLPSPPFALFISRPLSLFFLTHHKEMHITRTHTHTHTHTQMHTHTHTHTQKVAL
jgi:hypothetical protein